MIIYLFDFCFFFFPNSYKYFYINIEYVRMVPVNLEIPRYLFLSYSAFSILLSHDYIFLFIGKCECSSNLLIMF